MDRSEDELVAAIARVLSGAGPEVLVGIGDDAAVVRSGGGDLVLAADMLVEGVHFDRSLSSPREIGYRAVVVNVSDIAAMAASPRYVLVSLGLTDAVDAAWVMELFGGMRKAADEYACTLVGGDLDRASSVIVSIAITGEVAPGRVVLRSGARVSDRLVVTGSLGAAAGGLVVARASEVREVAATTWAAELVRAYQQPTARVGEARTLAAAGATSMMDLSDGLARDLPRLCAASGVGARIELPAVPVAEALLNGEGSAGIADPLGLAIGGGDDYELLATLPDGAVGGARAELRERFGVPLAEIGVIIVEGIVAVDAEGHEGPLPEGGWDHFAG